MLDKTYFRWRKEHGGLWIDEEGIGKKKATPRVYAAPPGWNRRSIHVRYGTVTGLWNTM